MFESLQTKLNAVFDKLASRGRLTEQNGGGALREVRLALLEADVNFKVVKQLVARDRAIGTKVMKSLTPAQMVVKIVHEELLATLGEPAKLDLSGPAPHVVMLVGLPRLRQDYDGRQAGPDAAQERQTLAAGRSGHLPSGHRYPARSARQAARHPGA